MSIPSFPKQSLKKLADELQSAATHAELEDIFRGCGINLPEGSRPKRIFGALVERQESDRCANNVVAFLQALLKPVRFIERQDDFQRYRHVTNLVLAFEGLHLNDSGKICAINPAATIDEAEARAGRLVAELKRRAVHHDVLRFCRAQFLEENYFHAILEATKSVAQKIRDRTGLVTDGSELVNAAFSTQRPLLVWNGMETSTQRSEHTGMMDLIKGMFSLFRNPTAHEPKITRSYTEDEALDLLTLVSFLHRRIDAAHRTHLIP